MDQTRINYLLLNRSVLEAVRAEQAALNHADTVNQNHGDHLASIWEVVVEVIEGMADQPAPDQIRQAAVALKGIPENGSAPLYRQILLDIATRIDEDNLDEGDVLRAASRLVHPAPEMLRGPGNMLSGMFRGALRHTGGWLNLGQMADQLGVGNLFESGLNLVNGGTTEGVLLDTAVGLMIQHSSLGRVPHRARGGQVVLRAALEELDRQQTRNF